MTRSLAAAACAWALLVAGSASAGQSLDYGQLVAQLTDLARLAELPAAGERCAQWSSYDRASKYDEATGKYVHWDANGDGTGIIRKEGEQSVMAEMEGPGCIFRIWSADALKGHVKIYLDGQPEPAVDMAFSEYFDGQHAPFAYPALSYDLRDQQCRGQNLYLPIPYQKSCKVVADKGWGRYFHFNYRTYPKGTQVPTFSSALAARHAADLAKANEFFAKQLGQDPAGPRAGQETVRKTVSVPAGQRACVAQLSGARAITAIRVKTTLADRDDQIAALRKLALAITWDGQPQPAVWCPLGDFFGTAPGENHYRSLPTGMTDDGYYACWYMPFAEKAVVELINEDAAARQVQMEIVHAPLGRPFAGLGHFHCKWHRDVFPLSADRAPDWVMLRAEGRGRFCGVMLHVWNPRGGWWGEGDEKFFVDGEKFPSTIGTGSEDYFGYAWGNPHLFQTAFHCQTMTQNNRGHQSLLRWHIVDDVPFASSFEGCIEKYFTNQGKGTLFACTVCWYLSPDGQDPFAAVPAAERFGYWVKPDFSEVAGFKILNEPQGSVDAQGLAHFGANTWTNNDHLWWTHAKPGAKLELALDVEKPGAYPLSVILTKARDYGIVQFHLDGQKVGQPIDLYNPKVIRTEPIALGSHTLTAGRHKLTVEIVGANPKAVPAYMFGLDVIQLGDAKK